MTHNIEVLVWMLYVMLDDYIYATNLGYSLEGFSFYFWEFIDQFTYGSFIETVLLGVFR